MAAPHMLNGRDISWSMPPRMLNLGLALQQQQKLQQNQMAAFPSFGRESSTFGLPSEQRGGPARAKPQAPTTGVPSSRTAGPSLRAQLGASVSGRLQMPQPLPKQAPAAVLSTQGGPPSSEMDSRVVTRARFSELDRLHCARYADAERLARSIGAEELACAEEEPAEAVEECELREEWRVEREDACAGKLLAEHSRRRDVLGGDGSSKGDEVTRIFEAGAEALLRAHHARGVGVDNVSERQTKDYSTPVTETRWLTVAPLYYARCNSSLLFPGHRTVLSAGLWARLLDGL